jgi:mono/diheme cytochrome c family protein
MRGALLVTLLVGLAACRQDMHDQPKYRPLRPSAFFRDGRASRPVVEGTVPRGALALDAARATGRIGKEYARNPLPRTVATFRRGRERYDIYCAPCHDRVGNGNGMIVRRGYKQPPSLHVDRLRDAPVGHFYDVITNGLGAMPDYSAQISVADRWKIVAYVRALQLSQRAAPGDVPPGEMEKLRTTATK